MILRNKKWDRRFLNLAKEISRWSKDPSTQVGAVVVKDGLIVGTGYNGFPRYVNDDEDRYLNREQKYKFIVHAELNAILLAGNQCKDASIYIWPSLAIPPCCNECAKAIIQSGIMRVVGMALKPEDGAGRWDESRKISKQMLEEAEVKIVEIVL